MRTSLTCRVIGHGKSHLQVLCNMSDTKKNTPLVRSVNARRRGAGLNVPTRVPYLITEVVAPLICGTQRSKGRPCFVVCALKGDDKYDANQGTESVLPQTNLDAATGADQSQYEFTAQQNLVFEGLCKVLVKLSAVNFLLGLCNLITGCVIFAFSYRQLRQIKVAQLASIASHQLGSIPADLQSSGMLELWQLVSGLVTPLSYMLFSSLMFGVVKEFTAVIKTEGNDIGHTLAGIAKLEKVLLNQWNPTVAALMFGFVSMLTTIQSKCGDNVLPSFIGACLPALSIMSSAVLEFM